jgi:DNA repair exonuclease SbcCD ATPase subunit
VLYDSFGIEEVATATDHSPVMIRTAGSTKPPIAAFKFDIEAVVQRMAGLRDSGYDSSQHAGAGRDVAAARRAAQRVEREQTRLEYSQKIVDDMQAKGLLSLPNGCDPRRVDDPDSEHHGEYLCIKCRHTELAAKNRAKTTDYGGGPNSLTAIIEHDEERERTKEQQEKEKESKRADREKAAAEKQAEAETRREELLTKVGKVEAALTSLSEMPANTSANIATQIEKLEQVVVGLNKNQHGKIAEAREQIDTLKQRKRDLMAAEQEERRREAEKEKVEKRREAEEKKRKQAHLKRLLSQDARDEKLEAIEKKRKKHGEDLDRWSATLLKASGGKKRKLVDVRQALEAILREHKTICECE